MLLEHERNYDSGMDALVSGCSWNTNGASPGTWRTRSRIFRPLNLQCDMRGGFNFRGNRLTLGFFMSSMTGPFGAPLAGIALKVPELKVEVFLKNPCTSAPCPGNLEGGWAQEKTSEFGRLFPLQEQR